MTRLLPRSALIICILAVTTQASAEIILLSQTRSVSLGGEPILAPDFGLFEESIVDSWSNWAPPFEGYYLSATQNSEIQTGHFSIHGDTYGESNDMYEFYGSAHSDFEVVFEVTVPTPFSLIGALALVGYSTGAISSLHLDWNGAPYLSFSLGYNQTEIEVSEHGVLEPGAYTLTVNALTIVWDDSYGSSSFNFDFFLETPVAVDEMAWGQVKALYR